MFPTVLIEFKQFNRAETGKDTDEKRENNWDEVLEGARRAIHRAHIGIDICQSLWTVFPL